MKGAIAALLVLLGAPALAQELEVVLVGNAGVMLSDGETALLVDLPYESGAFGYQRYDSAALAPCCPAVSVITHHHRDHFDAALFRARGGWRVVGPPSAVRGLPAERVIGGDSVTVGRFAVVAVPTAHTDDHRSYRIRWRGRVLFFTGDTEDPAGIPAEPSPDVLFVTPWLNCAARDAGRPLAARRTILYHLQRRGTDRVCGPVDVLPQGTRLTLSPVPR